MYTSIETPLSAFLIINCKHCLRRSSFMATGNLASHAKETMCQVPLFIQGRMEGRAFPQQTLQTWIYAQQPCKGLQAATSSREISIPHLRNLHQDLLILCWHLEKSQGKVCSQLTTKPKILFSHLSQKVPHTAASATFLQTSHISPYHQPLAHQVWLTVTHSFNNYVLCTNCVPNISRTGINCRTSQENSHSGGT